MALSVGAAAATMPKSARLPWWGRGLVGVFSIAGAAIPPIMQQTDELLRDLQVLIGPNQAVIASNAQVYVSFAVLCVTMVAAKLGNLLAGGVSEGAEHAERRGQHGQHMRSALLEVGVSMTQHADTLGHMRPMSDATLTAVAALQPQMEKLNDIDLAEYIQVLTEAASFCSMQLRALQAIGITDQAPAALGSG